MSRLVACLALFASVALSAGCTQLKEDEPAEKKPPKDEKIVGKFTREIMDREEVKANHPDWIVETPEVEATGPLTAIGTGYDSSTHKIAQISWTQFLNTHKVLNDDRMPTFAEAKEHVEKNSAGLPKLRPYRHWVYDASSGQLLLMLDVEERNKIYKQKGIPIPE